MATKAKPSETFTHHSECSQCGSSDAVGWYADGHGFCFSCEHTYLLNDKQKRDASKMVSEKKRERMSEKGLKTNKITPITDVFRAIPDRGLSKDAVEKFQIDVCMDESVDVAHRYPYFKDGKHVGNKVRKRSEKAFYWQAETRDDINGCELFGQHLFPSGSARAITVVEGELDAAAAYTLTGSRYPCVSVCSAGSAVRDVRRNYEYLNGFDEIVLCFDKDAAKIKPDGSVFYPGQQAAERVADMFEPGKVRIMSLQNGKDPNDYLINKIDPKVFVKEWYDAQPYRPDGLKVGSSMWDEIKNRPKHFSVPYPWAPLNQKTYGIRLAEAVLLMADTGIGKTSILKEMEYSILMNEEAREKKYGVGLLHLEEPNHDTATGLLSIHDQKPYHLPDTERDEDELRKAFDEVLNNERIILYDHFGSNDIDEILKKVRHMAVMGCKFIFIDHLSIIVSDQSGDERKQLDEISTKLKTMTMELNIACICVIHTNRQGEARGSAGPEKVANIHLSLHRDKKDSNPIRRNVLRVDVEKNRFCGRTGPTLWLYWDEESNRLRVLPQDTIDKYENGEELTDVDIPF